MKHIDPAKAARVWKRVQDSLAQPCPADPQPLPPLPVYTTPPDAWKQPAKPLRRRSRCMPQHNSFPWLWLLALILLLPQKNS